MEMTIYTDMPLEVIRKGFDNNLANAIWAIAIDEAPMDTGNLRRNISLTASTRKKTEIFYNAFNAPYLHYLEMAMGPIKKHKGYIDVKTVAKTFGILTVYFKKGLSNIYSRPTVQLGISRHGPMFSEKRLLKEMNLNLRTLNADERMQLGRIYSRSVTDSNQRTSRRGMQVEISKRNYVQKQTRTFDLFYTNQKLY